MLLEYIQVIRSRATAVQTTIRRPKRIESTLTPPGDKSVSHRAAIFNAIASGVAEIRNYGPGADCLSTIRVLRHLGVQVEGGQSTFTIKGGDLIEPVDVLNVGNSGTTARLMAGVLAAQPFFSVLTGDKSIRSRPMRRVVDPLRKMGAMIDGRGASSLAPLAFRGTALKSIDFEMPVASAQVKSALLLAGLFASGETILRQPALSRDHTERMFTAMGAAIHTDDRVITLRPGKLQAIDVTVPADISSAAYWIIAAVCHPNAELKVLNVGINPSRTGILEVLKNMGADLAVVNERSIGGEPVGDIVARSSSLRSTTVDPEMIPSLVDEVPILALAACFASGTTLIAGAQELRLKESDRLSTTATELSRFGADVEETADGLRITGGKALTGASGRSRNDHRIAMTLGIAGLLANGDTSVAGAESAAISYPSFWEDLNTLCR